MGIITNEGITEFFDHDAGDLVLTLDTAVVFGGDDDRVRGGYESVFHDCLTDLAEGDFGCEGVSVEDHWFVEIGIVGDV